jgi:hypothetical protein
VRPEGLGKLKKIIHHIWSRTRDLRACRIKPYLLHYGNNVHYWNIQSTDRNIYQRQMKANINIESGLFIFLSICCVDRISSENRYYIQQDAYNKDHNNEIVFDNLQIWSEIWRPIFCEVCIQCLHCCVSDNLFAIHFRQLKKGKVNFSRCEHVLGSEGTAPLSLTFALGGRDWSDSRPRLLNCRERERECQMRTGQEAGLAQEMFRALWRMGAPCREQKTGCPTY